MGTRTRSMIRPGVCALFFLLGAVGSASADDAKPAYPAMAPVEQYRVASASEEIELARSAAPISISSQASILTLGEHRYETTLKGRNGFVCMVERSWGAGFDDTQFWNPKVRSPICFSPAAARSVLPAYLERTEWALAGASKADMVSRTGAELAAKRIIAPEPGAMAYMMSKRQYLGDDPGHWHPHLMLFFTHADEADWGANLRGSPVSAAQDDSEHITTLFLLVPKWSDGTPALMETH
jgi:hypothetical protein